MNAKSHLVTYGAIALLALVSLHSHLAPNRRDRAEAQVSPIPAAPLPDSPELAAPSPASGSGKLLKINLSVTSPEDLKVREGDIVGAGQVLADRDKERQQLESQKAQVQLALEKIKGATLIPPPVPLAVPEVRELPPLSHVEEEAAIDAVRVALGQAQRNYELALSETALLTETAAVEAAQSEEEAAQREVELQQRKLDAIASLNGLPPEVVAHETEVLKRKMGERDRAEAKYRQKLAELENARAARTGRLKTLADEVGKVQANLKLAQSRLETVRDKRNYDEYQHSITKAQRIEESNQAAQAQARQQQEYQQQQRDRDFKTAQLEQQLAEVESKLLQLSTVRSPYSGTIRRIKQERQTDNTLSIELTLVRSDSTSASPSRSGNSAISPLGGGNLGRPLPTQR